MRACLRVCARTLGSLTCPDTRLRLARLRSVCRRCAGRGWARRARRRLLLRPTRRRLAARATRSEPLRRVQEGAAEWSGEECARRQQRLRRSPFHGGRRGRRASRLQRPSASAVAAARLGWTRRRARDAWACAARPARERERRSASVRAVRASGVVGEWAVQRAGLIETERLCCAAAVGWVSQPFKQRPAQNHQRRDSEQHAAAGGHATARCCTPAAIRATGTVAERAEEKRKKNCAQPVLSLVLLSLRCHSPPSTAAPTHAQPRTRKLATASSQNRCDQLQQRSDPRSAISPSDAAGD